MDKLISDEVERTAVRRLSLSLAIIGIIRRCTNIFNGVSSSRVWLVLYASSLSSLPYNTPVSKHNSSARLTGKHSSVLSLSLSLLHSTTLFYRPFLLLLLRLFFFGWIVLLGSTMTYFVCVRERALPLISLLFEHFTCDTFRMKCNAIQSVTIGLFSCPLHLSHTHTQRETLHRQSFQVARRRCKLTLPTHASSLLLYARRQSSMAGACVKRATLSQPVAAVRNYSGVQQTWGISGRRRRRITLCNPFSLKLS